MKTVRYTNQILVISGSVIEIYSYDEPVRIDPLPQSTMRSRWQKDRGESGDRKASSIYRARKQVKRLLNANTGVHLKKNGKPYRPVLITLTFAKNMQDIDEANSRYTKFIQRFNYFLFQEKKNRLRYVVVIEFQKRGAIHYHAVFFNLPYRTTMKTDVPELWGQGFANVKAIERIKDVGNYIMKYLTKGGFDHRLFGKKCYFFSRNLFKSVEIKDPDKVRLFLQLVKPEGEVYEKRADRPAYGPAYKYQKYIAKDIGVVRSFLDLFVKPGYLDPKI